MERLAAVIAALPEQALAIRRLYLCDPDFRAMCDDYADAAEALTYWGDANERAADYRHIIAELQQEITAILERRHVSMRRCGGSERADDG